MAILLSPVGDALPFPSSRDGKLDASDINGLSDRERMALERQHATALLQERFRNRYVGYFDLWEKGEQGITMERCIVASDLRRENVVTEVREWRKRMRTFAETQVTIDFVSLPPEPESAK